jgi:hypothetical protein
LRALWPTDPDLIAAVDLLEAAWKCEGVRRFAGELAWVGHLLGAGASLELAGEVELAHTIKTHLRTCLLAGRLGTAEFISSAVRR